MNFIIMHYTQKHPPSPSHTTLTGTYTPLHPGVRHTMLALTWSKNAEICEDRLTNIPMPREASSTGCCIIATRLRFSGVGKYSESLLRGTESLSSSESLTCTSAGSTVTAGHLLEENCGGLSLPAEWKSSSDGDWEFASCSVMNPSGTVEFLPEDLFPSLDLFPSWLISLFLAEERHLSFLVNIV